MLQLQVVVLTFFEMLYWGSISSSVDFTGLSAAFIWFDTFCIISFLCFSMLASQAKKQSSKGISPDVLWHLSLQSVCSLEMGCILTLNLILSSSYLTVFLLLRKLATTGPHSMVTSSKEHTCGPTWLTHIPEDDKNACHIDSLQETMKLMRPLKKCKPCELFI